MFSVATPSMSLRPFPPQPMAAMLSLSLGATKPRPRTWRGTMVNAAAAVVLRTNVRRVIRFLPIRFSSTMSLYGFSLRRLWSGSEQDREQHQNHEGHGGRIHPNAVPVV